MAFIPRTELEKMGFKALGENVNISEKASLYGVSRMEIGHNVRVDDFCVLSAGEGGIIIGNFIHIAVYASLIGAGRIALNDFCNISSRVAIYSSNDDYSGEAMTNPMIPEEFTHVTKADVSIGRHGIIGSGSIILPGVTLGEGVAVGAMTLITKDCEPFGIYVGTPAKRIKERSRKMLDIEKVFIARQ